MSPLHCSNEAVVPPALVLTLNIYFVCFPNLRALEQNGLISLPLLVSISELPVKNHLKASNLKHAGTWLR